MEKLQLPQASYETDGVPTLYCNVANVTVSFSDLRLYLAEVTPQTIVVNPAVPTALGAINTDVKSLVSPKLSVVFNPEFAKSVGEAILLAVHKYEAIFGPLRTPKTVQQVTTAIEENQPTNP